MGVPTRREALKLTAAGAALAGAAALSAQAVVAQGAQPNAAVKQLEDRIQELRRLVAELAAEKDFQDALSVMRTPGWKPSQAEIVLLTVVVDVLLAVVKAAVAVKKDQVKAIREVAAR